jgi:hypothetical protein
MPRITIFLMATIAEVEKLALDLPEGQRAVLAAHLLGSLPSILHDEDEGIAEALRRERSLTQIRRRASHWSDLTSKSSVAKDDAANPSPYWHAESGG